MPPPPQYIYIYIWVYMDIWVKNCIYGHIWVYTAICGYILLYVYVFLEGCIILNLWQRDCSTLPPNVGAFSSDTPHC